MSLMAWSTPCHLPGHFEPLAREWQGMPAVGFDAEFEFFVFLRGFMSVQIHAPTLPNGGP
jgi:hypothetical protein